MQRTKIEYIRNSDNSQGYSCNPITGKCLHNCSWHGIECWAETMRKRFKRPEKMAWYPEKLEEIKKIKKPSTIFIGSTYDIFGQWVLSNYTEKIISVIQTYPEHLFLFLTKNPGRYEEYFKLPTYTPKNLWLGVTWTEESLAPNVKIRPHWKMFVSYEPLLSNRAFIPDLKFHLKKEYHNVLRWIIIGTLNRNGRPIKPEKGGTRKEWILKLVEQADRFKIPVFIKSEAYRLYPDLSVRKELPYLK